MMVHTWDSLPGDLALPAPLFLACWQLGQMPLRQTQQIYKAGVPRGGWLGAD